VEGQGLVGRPAERLEEPLPLRLGERRGHGARHVEPRQRPHPVEAALVPLGEAGPALLLQEGELGVAPGLHPLGHVVEVLGRGEAAELGAVRVDDPHLAVQEGEPPRLVHHPHRVGAHPVGLALDGRQVLAVLQHRGAEGLERVHREGHQPRRPLAQPLQRLRLERPRAAARQGEDRVDGAAADGGHQVAGLLAHRQDAPAERRAHLGDDPQHVAHGSRGLGADDEVRPAHVPVVEEVVLEDEEGVVGGPERPGGGRRRGAVHGVERLHRGQVVGGRADAADVGGELGHLLGDPAHAEALEAAQLRHLQEGVLGVPLLVEQDLHLAVPLEARDGVDGDAAGHGAGSLRTRRGTRPAP